MKIVAVGELLWDVFPDSERLGGAPLNFSVHARRLGHDVVFLTAVGEDERGLTARACASSLGLPAGYIQQVSGAPTGAVTVELDAAGKPAFTIHRPAAYDLLRLDAAAMARLGELKPDWLYYGTLHQTDPHIRALDRCLMDTLRGTRRFYDVNLRRDSYNPELVDELMRRAHVVKLNDEEVEEVDRMAGLRHASLEAFCHDWSARMGWDAVCVTRGAQGCAVFTAGQYVEAPGFAVKVVDTVGAGDAFAAAFLHGLSLGWPPARTAGFANRLGAVVASRAGGVPEWTVADCEALVA